MADRDDFKKHYDEMREELKRDIRPMIVRGNGYNPEKNQHKEWIHKPYPTWVHVKNSDGSTNSFIAQNKEEEDAILGRKPAPAKVATVEVNKLEKVVAPQKRKYTKRVAPSPLPANLE
jgi:carbamoylphosphate synthase large subunit